MSPMPSIKGMRGRLVHCSTVGVHGDVAEIPATEDTPFAPGYVYQRTKLEGELLIRRAHREGAPGVDLPAARHLRTRRSPVPQAVQDDLSTHVPDDRLRRRAVSHDAYRRLSLRHHPLWRAPECVGAHYVFGVRATRRFASSSIRLRASQACRRRAATFPSRP